MVYLLCHLQNIGDNIIMSGLFGANKKCSYSFWRHNSRQGSLSYLWQYKNYLYELSSPSTVHKSCVPCIRCQWCILNLITWRKVVCIVSCKHKYSDNWINHKESYLWDYSPCHNCIRKSGIPYLVNLNTTRAKWSASCADHFCHGERLTSAHWTRDCMGTRVILEMKKGRLPPSIHQTPVSLACKQSL